MTNPLYADLRKERYAKKPVWWVTTKPEENDSPLMQGIRRRQLTDVPEDDHEIEEVA
jgi:hypothetical protein